MPYFLKPNLYYYSWSILIAFTLSFNANLVVYTFTLRASLRVSLFLFWRRKGNIVCAHTQTFSCFFNTFIVNFDIGQRRIVFAHIMFVIMDKLTSWQVDELTSWYVVNSSTYKLTNLSHHYLLCMCLLSVRDAKDVYALLLSFGRDDDGVSSIAYWSHLVSIHII